MEPIDVDEDDKSSVESFPLPREAYLNGPPSAINGAFSGEPSVLSAATVTTMLPPERPNINFKPVTTVVSKNSKLKLHVLLDSTISTAGGILNGRLVLTSSTSRSLKMGEISVELTAYEELTTREYTATQSFLSSRLVFQGANLPASNAVHGPKDNNGFWTAKKGKTTFPFSFKIPIDAPSSVAFGNMASLRYVVTGVVQIYYNNKEDTIFKSKEAFVVEAWDGHNPIYKEPIDAANTKQLWMGGSGAVTIEGTLIETLFTSGGNVSAQVRVRNDTKRKVQGLKVAITHRLIILANKNKKEAEEAKIISETISEEWFKNKDFLFDCGEDRTVTVNLHVPNTVRTIRNTALFEVTCFIAISLYCGPFTKDLTVELPASICHSASLQPPPVADVDLNHFPNHYNMIDENNDFFVEDLRQDEYQVLGEHSRPVNIPERTRGLPWSDGDDEGYRGHHSPLANSAGSSILGSTSPKKLGSLFLGRPKQMSPPNPSKLIPKSPPLAPASPYAYIPAIERVRYLSFATQEQAALQGKNRAVPPRKGYGIYSNAHVPISGAPSEFEFVPEPSTAVKKWLENQQSSSCPGSPDLTHSTSYPKESPWAHINQIQGSINVSPSNSPRPLPPIPSQQGTPIPVPTTTLTEENFRKDNSTPSSPSGPSGLTILMKQRPGSPSIIDQFANPPPSNTVSPEFEHVPRGRPLPQTPPTKNTDQANEKPIEKPAKSKYLQVPRFENASEEPEKPAPDVASSSSLAVLLKWGSSLIGYGNTTETPTGNQSIDSTKNTEPNETRKLTNNKPDTEPLITDSKEPETESLTTDSKEPETIAPQTSSNDVTASSGPHTTISSSDKPKEDLPDKSVAPPLPTRPITKASIFAALGQKKSSPPPVLKPALPESKQINPQTMSQDPQGNSPPKQKGFSPIPRKPLSENKFLNEADKAIVIVAETDFIEEVIDEKHAMVEMEKKNDPICESSSNNKNHLSRPHKNIDIGVITSRNPQMPNSPPIIRQTKIIATPTTYVNTTIPKPIMSLDKIVKRRKKKVGVLENGEEDGLTAKITEPPKQVVAPRIQQYIQQYSAAASGTDAK